MSPQEISTLIDASPYNRGMKAAEILSRSGTIALHGNGAVALFVNCGDRMEGHWLKAASTGERTIAFGRHAIKAIFAMRPDVKAIVGQTPIEHRAALWMARRLGFVAGDKQHTSHGIIQHFSLTREQFERA